MNNNQFIRLTVNEAYYPKEHGWVKTCDEVIVNVSQIAFIEKRKNFDRSMSYVKLVNDFGYDVKESIDEIADMLSNNE